MRMRGGYEHLLLNVVANPCGLTLADPIYTQHTHTNISLSAAPSVCIQRHAADELLIHKITSRSESPIKNGILFN